MSLSPTQGPRPTAQAALPASAQAAGVAAGLQTASASGKVAARLPTVDPVTLQDDVVSLSILGLQARGELRTSTSEAAQGLVSKIAQNLFGEQTQTSTISYNLSSLKSSPALPDSASLSESPQAVNFRLEQSIDFVGTGQIATNDGQVFDFEVKVKFETKVEANGAPLFEPVTIDPPDMLVLTGKPLPAIEFPGSLNDLFKLLSRELRTGVSDGGSPASEGNLTLRLLRLVDRAALLAPRARPDDPDATPVERAKAAATAYANAKIEPSSVGDLSEA